MKATTPFHLAAFTVAAALAPLGAGAQTRPAPQRVLSHGVAPVVPLAAPKRAASGVQVKRRWVGTIQQIGTNSFTVLRRNGKIGTVDDTAAVANGTYSAPLFIGKIVIIIGSYEPAAHIMHADTITRMTYYDPGTPSETTP